MLFGTPNENILWTKSKPSFQEYIEEVSSFLIPILGFMPRFILHKEVIGHSKIHDK
jgi:hypothetical protein